MNSITVLVQSVVGQNMRVGKICCNQSFFDEIRLEIRVVELTGFDCYRTVVVLSYLVSETVQKGP
jgi:hypothetical protein